MGFLLKEKSMGRRVKNIIVVVLIVLIGLGCWSISKKLISSAGEWGIKKDTETVQTNTEVSEDRVIIRDEISNPDGTFKNQVGTKEEKSVQCVYDYFEEYLPELEFAEKEYSIKDIGDDNYCVNIGDWYIFVKNESNISYPYKFTKSTEFTEDEKSYIKSVMPESIFVEEGDLYVWKVNED